MRHALVGALLLTVASVLAPIHTEAQDSAAKRRLLDHATPAYPALARTMALQGVVRVDVLVQPDGSVKSVDIQGGHPVLAQAAVNAVHRWKWEAAPHESHEVVPVKFTPPE